MVKEKWLRKYISNAGLKSVNEAVVKGEENTDAEIVPMVVRRSSDYYQSAMTLRMIGLVLFAFTWLWLDRDTHWDQATPSAVILIICFVVFCILLPKVYKYDWIKRLLTHRFQEEEQAFKRAKIEFYENCAHLTERREGILIFVSLLERKVVVLADQRISDKLPENTWEAVVNHVVAGVRQGDLAGGLEEGIATCASVLAEHFPKTPTDKDELSNELLIKE